jgi:hypothetical protein
MLTLTDDEQQKLETWADRLGSTQQLATRARIVLACAAVSAGGPRSPSTTLLGTDSNMPHPRRLRRLPESTGPARCPRGAI